MMMIMIIMIIMIPQAVAVGRAPLPIFLLTVGFQLLMHVKGAFKKALEPNSDDGDDGTDYKDDDDDDDDNTDDNGQSMTHGNNNKAC